jgi:hypothetical protein
MSHDRRPPLAVSMLVAAMAGGMGWGIRGQYGHETGAMIAGVLVGLVLVLRFCPGAASLAAARAAALFALGISLGGSMTYGQTVGLTHDPEMVGNWQALGWGLLGLFIKGGIWISLAATFLAIGLSGKRYHSVDLALLLITTCFLWFLGVYVFNEPYDPASRLLPRIYFSDDWRWQPTSDLQPRREVWGGLLLALVGMVLYARIAKRDRLALRLAVWGFLGGGLGFSLGQCVQAAHAWNIEWFRTVEFIKQLDPYINWWNMMETSFGALFGAVLALAVWLNRQLIQLPNHTQAGTLPEPELSLTGEWLLVIVHIAAVSAWSFISFAAFDRFADQAITMIIIPTVAVVAGRWWPSLVLLPVVLVPIAGKTVRELVYRNPTVSIPTGWVAYLAIPLALTLLAAWWLVRRQHQQPAGRFASTALLINTWIYFWLNFAFFRNPWPWQTWTGRTPNALIFFICAVGLSLAALAHGGTTEPAAEEV